MSERHTDMELKQISTIGALAIVSVMIVIYVGASVPLVATYSLFAGTLAGHSMSKIWYRVDSDG